MQVNKIFYLESQISGNEIHDSGHHGEAAKGTNRRD